MLIEHIARVCHEANVAYCIANGEAVLGHWDECPEWQRDSCIKGVEYAVKNTGAKPSAQHDAWLKDKIENGWVFGLVKDPEKKTHPCCVEYDELPESQKKKDVLFLSIVRAIS